MIQREGRGLVLVNTGPGKGKTTAALGAALRASGQGLRVMILQFIKARETGELKAIEHVPGIEIKQAGRGMIIHGRVRPQDRQAARWAWEECLARAYSENYDLLVLDEICLAVHFGLVETDEVLKLIQNKPYKLHLILTGRNCPEEILAAADMVTIMEARKHHLSAGVKAQSGIEF